VSQKFTFDVLIELLHSISQNCHIRTRIFDLQLGSFGVMGAFSWRRSLSSQTLAIPPRPLPAVSSASGVELIVTIRLFAHVWAGVRNA